MANGQQLLHHLNYLVLNPVVAEDLAHAHLVGVGDEDLPEMLLPHHLQQSRDAGFVKFVKNIIQQQDGFYLLFFLRLIELGQAQSQGKGLLLSLRPEALHGLPIDEEGKIILVDAKIGEAASGIGHGVLAKALRVGGFQ